ncbi:MAG: PD-(D/E)XK nuclease family protein, partial [Planctomycetota bacterium]
IAVLTDPPPLVGPRPPAPEVPPPGPDALREAERRLAEARADVAPLGATPYVVTVSDLTAFARSPAALYAARLEPRLEAAVESAGEEYAGPESGPDPGAVRREERRRLFDESHGGDGPDDRGGIDRAAVGRALHRLLEGLPPGAEAAGEDDLDLVLEEEFDGGAPPGTGDLLRTMVARFLASGTGRRFAEALARDEDVRREVAFHARIRFPAGGRVGPFEGLLVRGAIDLWLPGSDGVRIVDYKTNAPSRHLPTPEAVAAWYEEQLRLYALAAERMLGTDVAGVGLVLVDPAWGEAAPELAIDVSGPLLERTRGLCRAYARAALENRWPDSVEAFGDD